jgi:hypothetical protein
MRFPRFTGLLAAVLIPAAGFWVYSLNRSFGEMDSLMQWVPADTDNPGSDVDDEPVRMTTIAADRAGVSPAVADDADQDLDVASPPRAPATAPVVRDPLPAAQIAATDDPSQFAGEEFPYQRTFDPYVYDQIVEEHYANQPEWRLPPGVESREALESAPDADPAAGSRPLGALHD